MQIPIYAANHVTPLGLIPFTIVDVSEKLVNDFIHLGKSAVMLRSATWPRAGSPTYYLQKMEAKQKVEVSHCLVNLHRIVVFGHKAIVGFVDDKANLIPMEPQLLPGQTDWFMDIPEAGYAD